MYKTHNKMRSAAVFIHAKKRRCKKSATKPVDFLDMEAHGL